MEQHETTDTHRGPISIDGTGETLWQATVMPRARYTFAIVNGQLVAWPWRADGTVAPAITCGATTLTPGELARVVQKAAQLSA
jgi:hypothetical protein